MAAVETARKVFAAAKVAGGEMSLLATADLARALRTSNRLAQSVGLRSAMLDPNAEDRESLYNSEKLRKVFARADRSNRGAISFDDLGTMRAADALALLSRAGSIALANTYRSPIAPLTRLQSCTASSARRSKRKPRQQRVRLRRAMVAIIVRGAARRRN